MVTHEYADSLVVPLKSPAFFTYLKQNPDGNPTDILPAVIRVCCIYMQMFNYHYIPFRSFGSRPTQVHVSVHVCSIRTNT